MKTLSFNYASLKTAAFALGLATVMGFSSIGIASASDTQHTHSQQYLDISSITDDRA